jgi:hypothetical protein
MTTVGFKGPGARVLICPECLNLLDNAGPGRGFCIGQRSTHDEVEMLAYVPETAAPSDGEDEASAAPSAPDRPSS